MELIEKLRKQLSEEYGIHSDQELMDAIAHDRVFYWRTLMDKIELIDEEESEPAPEQRARNLIESLATSQLLDQWEMTTTMTDPNTSTLRGWFMDELEKRFPDQFDKWLDSDCRDEDLRKFIYA